MGPVFFIKEYSNMHKRLVGTNLHCQVAKRRQYVKTRLRGRIVFVTHTSLEFLLLLEGVLVFYTHEIMESGTFKKFGFLFALLGLLPSAFTLFGLLPSERQLLAFLEDFDRISVKFGGKKKTAIVVLGTKIFRSPTGYGIERPPASYAVLPSMDLTRRVLAGVRAMDNFNTEDHAVLVLSGGVDTNEAGAEGLSEARVMWHTMDASKRTTSTRNVLLEERSTTTFTNAIEVKKLLTQKKTFPHGGLIKLVTSGFHQRRSRRVFERAFKECPEWEISVLDTEGALEDLKMQKREGLVFKTENSTRGFPPDVLVEEAVEGSREYSMYVRWMVLREVLALFKYKWEGKI